MTAVMGLRGRAAAITVTVVACGVATVAFAAPAHAAGPQVDWDCELIRIQGTIGPAVMFDPRAEVSWSGRKLSYSMWAWSSPDTRKSQAGRTYGTITASSGWNTANLDLSHEFMTGEEYEYKKVVLKVKDSRGRSHTATCEWDGPVANGW